MKTAAWYSAAVTAAVLPLVYWVTWRVLTGPFSPEVQPVISQLDRIEAALGHKVDRQP